MVACTLGAGVGGLFGGFEIVQGLLEDGAGFQSQPRTVSWRTLLAPHFARLLPLAPTCTCHRDPGAEYRH
eukprot:2520477-Amphidinium_carterae.1